MTHIPGRSAASSDGLAGRSATAGVPGDGAGPGHSGAYRSNGARLVTGIGQAVARCAPHTLGTWIEDQGWRPRTKQIHARQARALKRWGRDEGYTSRSSPPSTGPHARPAAAAHLTAKEAFDLLGAAEVLPCRVAAALATLAGMRLGEALAAAWADVDCEGQSLLVHRQKTHAQPRVPMQGKPVKILAPERCEDASPICPGLEGSISLRALHSLCTSLGLRLASMHPLRRTFATILVASGADVPTVQHVMGHTPGSPVTLKYFRADPERLRAAVDAMLPTQEAPADAEGRAPPPPHEKGNGGWGDPRLTIWARCLGDGPTPQGIEPLQPARQEDPHMGEGHPSGFSRRKLSGLEPAPSHFRLAPDAAQVLG